METLCQYSDLYYLIFIIDILLLVDIFENFRVICQKIYNLDSAFYYTVPGFSFVYMLKYTEKQVQLKLLFDYNMILLIEKGTTTFF
jgi:hypothetical protein